MNQWLGKVKQYLGTILLAVVVCMISASPASAVFPWENIGADPYYSPKVRSRSDLVTFCNTKGQTALETLDRRLGPALDLSHDKRDALLYALKCVSSDNPMPSLRYQRNWSKSVDRDYNWQSYGSSGWKFTCYATIHGPETYFGGMIYGNGVVRPDVVQKFEDTLYYEAVLRTENCLYFASIPWCGNLTVTTQWFICKKEKEVEIRWKTREVPYPVPGPTIEIVKKQYVAINLGGMCATVPIPQQTVYVQQPSHGWGFGLSLGLGFFDSISRFRTSTRVNNSTTYSINASGGNNTNTANGGNGVGGAGGIGQGGAGGSSTNTNSNDSQAASDQTQTTGDVNTSSNPNVAVNPSITGGQTTVTTGDVNSTSQSSPQVTGPNVTNNNNPSITGPSNSITNSPTTTVTPAITVSPNQSNTGTVNPTVSPSITYNPSNSVTGPTTTVSPQFQNTPTISGPTTTISGPTTTIENSPTSTFTPSNTVSGPTNTVTATGGQNTGTFTPNFTQTGGNTNVNATGGTGGTATSTSSAEAAAAAAAAAQAAANQSQFIKTQTPQVPITPGPGQQQQSFPQQGIPQQGSGQQPFPTQGGGQQPGQTGPFIQSGSSQVPQLGGLQVLPGAILPGSSAQPQSGLITVPQQGQQQQGPGQPPGQSAPLITVPVPGQTSGQVTPGQPQQKYPYQILLENIEKKKLGGVTVQAVPSKKK